VQREANKASLARGEDFSPGVQAATAHAGVDVVIDNVGSQLFEPIRRSLALGGRWFWLGS
jgi:NADPH:quinone reductase-like Zn-dependent oxidoreductase